MSSELRKRDDILVSICLSDIPSDKQSCDQILRVAQLLRSEFTYWEIVLVVDQDTARLPEVRKLTAQIENLRVMVVRSASGFYRMRNVAASEAIGDIVVLTSLSEIETVDLLKLIDMAANGSEAVVCTRNRVFGWSPLFAVLRALSGYDINSSDTLTTAYPRLWLNRLLEGQEADLALRFPPTSEGFPIRRMPVSGTRKRRRDLRSTVRRVALLGDVMSNSAPRLLLGTAVLSMFVALAAISYAAYAIVVWTFKADVQAGWLSTSVVLSLIAAFLGCALSALTMGIFKILDRLREGVRYTIIDEFSNVDLFSDVQALNVEKMEASAELEADAARKIA